MQNSEVYLFGQILGTHSFLLKDGFLQPDEYSEIKDQYFLPGGETGTAATVLDSLGVSVKMAGTWIGTQVAPMLKNFYADKKVDLSLLEYMENDPEFFERIVSQYKNMNITDIISEFNVSSEEIKVFSLLVYGKRPRRHGLRRDRRTGAFSHGQVPNPVFDGKTLVERSPKRGSRGL